MSYLYYKYYVTFEGNIQATPAYSLLSNPFTAYSNPYFKVKVITHFPKNS